MKKYDYVIVGAGLSGCVCARQLADKGYDCLVVDKNDYVGGLCAVDTLEGVEIQRSGVHVFHTDIAWVNGFVERISVIRKYRHKCVAYTGGKYYPFPINLLTLNMLYGVTTPEEAESILSDKYDELLSMFFVGYSEKQWGVPFADVPGQAIKRIPFRSTFDDTYFHNAKYEGMIDFNVLFRGLLLGVDLMLGESFDRSAFKGCKIVYTGRIDEFFDYRYGELKYRSVRFENRLAKPQGIHVINHVSSDVPYTRTIEYLGKEDRCIIQTEFPSDDGMPAYPFIDRSNNELYMKYRALALREENVDFIGRLATFSYLNMDEAIHKALLYCATVPYKRG